MRPGIRPSSPFGRRRSSYGGLAVIAILLIVIASVLGVSCYKNSEATVTATVSDKERVCKPSSEGGNTCEYLVFTNVETFKVTDSVVYGRFNSSDIYGRIRPDKTYEFRVAGWRIPFFSSYRNIVEVREVPQ